MAHDRGSIWPQEMQAVRSLGTTKSENGDETQEAEVRKGDRSWSHCSRIA